MNVISQIASTISQYSSGCYRSPHQRAVAIGKLQQHITQLPVFDSELSKIVQSTASKYDLPRVKASPAHVKAFYTKQLAKLTRAKDGVSAAIFDSWRGCLLNCIKNTESGIDLRAKGMKIAEELADGSVFPSAIEMKSSQSYSIKPHEVKKCK
jgi:uncharacterized protein with gpF-like domain